MKTRHTQTQVESQNQRISMRTDFEVLNSVDLIITTRISDSECVSEVKEQMLNSRRRATYAWFVFVLMCLLERKY